MIRRYPPLPLLATALLAFRVGACSPCESNLSWQQSLFLADIVVVGESTERPGAGLRGEGSPVPWRTIRVLSGDSATGHHLLQRSADHCPTGFSPSPSHPYLLLVSRDGTLWKPSTLCAPYQFELHGDTLTGGGDRASLADVERELATARILRGRLARSDWSLHRSTGMFWVILAAPGTKDPPLLSDPRIRDIGRERVDDSNAIFFRFAP